MDSDQLSTGPKVAQMTTLASKKEAREPESHIPEGLPEGDGCGSAESALVFKTAEKSGEGEDDKKQEREHKRRSKNWTRMETLKLIRFRTEMEHRFLRSSRKSDLWVEISEKLRKEGIRRDLQQCRDKWEKLTAGYKEVREGGREKVDFAFFDELDPILSGKSQRIRDILVQRMERGDQLYSDDEEADDVTMTEYFPAKKQRSWRSSGSEALDALKDLLETLISRQQKFFVEVLDAIERREKIRETIRQEMEEKWREEDRAQRLVFQNAMILLTKRLVGETGSAARFQSDSGDGVLGASPTGTAAGGALKKRSRNWKRSEILLLIKARRGMEGRFAKSTRRAALWEEVAAALWAEGVKRDGKQCRDKWDKLMAELKDVSDGKRGSDDCRYYADLFAHRSPRTENPTAAVDLEGPVSPT
ncbi:trihelix transcription factor GT-2-like [Aristolochia californica]|uniref:trihelix transcription factor GT-2-like n=1 Tax=Aristolochia californica TaxID=171875 RepID=UPI0035E24C79